MAVIIKSNENKDAIEKALKSLKHQGKLDAYKYLGKLKLKVDPLKIQEELRDEWR